MALLNFSRLPSRSFAKAQNLNESVRLYSGKPMYRIFLSYRHRDRDLVGQVVDYLHRLSPDVYIDFLDDALNNAPSSQTAPILRQRIQQSKKLIQLLSPNSGESKWMPWELGLGDGMLGYPNSVILPGITDYSSTLDQDYIKMYGRIESSNAAFGLPNDLTVVYPDRTSIGFKQWLAN